MKDLTPNEVENIWNETHQTDCPKCAHNMIWSINVSADFNFTIMIWECSNCNNAIEISYRKMKVIQLNEHEASLYR